MPDMMKALEDLEPLLPKKLVKNLRTEIQENYSEEDIEEFMPEEKAGVKGFKPEEGEEDEMDLEMFMMGGEEEDEDEEMY